MTGGVEGIAMQVSTDALRQLGNGSAKELVCGRPLFRQGFRGAD